MNNQRPVHQNSVEQRFVVKATPEGNAVFYGDVQLTGLNEVAIKITGSGAHLMLHVSDDFVQHAEILPENVSIISSAQVRDVLKKAISAKYGQNTTAGEL